MVIVVLGRARRAKRPSLFAQGREFVNQCVDACTGGGKTGSQRVSFLGECVDLFAEQLIDALKFFVTNQQSFNAVGELFDSGHAGHANGQEVGLSLIVGRLQSGALVLVPNIRLVQLNGKQEGHGVTDARLTCAAPATVGGRPRSMRVWSACVLQPLGTCGLGRFRRLHRPARIPADRWFRLSALRRDFSSVTCGDAGWDSCLCFLIMLFKNSTRKASGVGLAVCSVVSGAWVPAVWATPSVDPVVVTAIRQPERLSASLADVTVISRDDIERSGASTLEELLARQSGLSYSSFGGPGATSSVFVRGTNSSHVLLLVDGVRVGSVSAGTPNWSRLPLGQIDRVEVVRGPLSSLYGSDAIGGVVQVFTRQAGDRSAFEAELAAGTQGTLRGHVSSSGVNDRFRYALTSSYERTHGIDATRGVDDGDDLDGFEQGAVNAYVGYQLSAQHGLALNYLFGRGESGYDGYAAPDATSRTNTSNLSATWSAQWTPQWRAVLHMGQGVDDAQERSMGAAMSRARSTQRQLSWQHDMTTSMGNWTLGFERLEQRLVATSSYDQTGRDNVATFAAWQWSPGSHSIQVSARRERNSQYGGQQTGSMAYGYRWNTNWRGSLSYGTAFKAPAFSDLYFPQECYPGYGCFGGNPDLRPERARNREAALHYERGQHQLSLRWYLNQVRDLIVWGNTPSNVGQARLEGWTLTYKTVVAGVDLAAQVDQLSAVDEATGQMLLKRAGHSGTVSAARRWGGWDWRLELHGQGARQDFGGERMGGYGLLNAYVSKRLATPGWSVFAKADNLGDRTYELSRGYRTMGLSALVGLRYTMP